MTYSIYWNDGRVDRGYETELAAIDVIQTEYPDAEVGHDGDLADGGDRTLVWEDLKTSENDDGARALASIRIDRIDHDY